jgi:hypothetical protein
MTESQAANAVRRGRGPPGIDRIDAPRVLGEQWHAHLGPGTGSIAVNKDGTWKHLGRGATPPNLTARQRTFLSRAGWNV